MAKELVDTIAGVSLTTKRRDGNSTRQVNYAVDMLFKGYRVKVLNHYEYGGNKTANRLLMSQIIDRLRVEHHLLGDNMKIDPKNLIIELI